MQWIQARVLGNGWTGCSCAGVDVDDDVDFVTIKNQPETENLVGETIKNQPETENLVAEAEISTVVSS